ncbi:protein phosphatase 2C domain-containing protein [Ornithinimicrobium cerasi]|uniref:protein phosphatase 2C domain-containing protein n=1 Tax=Ornithinimicrobium cerasi TaxID=2248773 RepID=UPI00137B575B|nr:protein phosphatase 2C domain-containing protein [Ornithinimicrobium cerasi]
MGEGQMNEDLAGDASHTAWMLDGATDVPRTYLPDHSVTGAYWLVHQINALLAKADAEPDHAKLLSRLAQNVAVKLRQHGMTAHDLPPACSLGIVTLESHHVVASIVGDVYIFHQEQDTLLSESQFGENERRAVLKRATTQNSATAGIEERRRGYLRGANGQWVMANNPDVWQGVASRQWRCFPGDHILLATDGFARAVTDYGLFPDWTTLAKEVTRQGAATVLGELRSYERSSTTDARHFKKSDDACVSLYQVEGKWN